MQRTSACPSLVVSCPKFDLAHSKAHCKGRKGDFLSLGSQRLGTNTKVTDLAVIYVSQVLPKERAKKFQLQCRPAHCHLQIKHDRRGWGCRVFHCLLRSWHFASFNEISMVWCSLRPDVGSRSDQILWKPKRCNLRFEAGAPVQKKCPRIEDILRQRVKKSRGAV